ncbi:His/Gly/Thr/Pro-type tRNA ligase C-terminal domain-containing protein [Variovorax sp. GB1P17]|uniref:His/Gly/Thr/Pro-type tRNA ligase C-terminal domain-containing protein n=1 Tax=Variovorax sp. GB1P17 TaxID=3443740 RepID=UPI003F44E5F5
MSTLQAGMVISAYARDMAQLLRGTALRAEADVRNEKTNYKLREQTMQRIPFLLVLGAQEAASGTVVIHSQDGKDLGVCSIPEAVALLQAQAEAPDLAASRSAQAALWASLTSLAGGVPEPRQGAVA